MHIHLKCLAAAAIAALSLTAHAEKVHISTPGTSLLLDATEGKPLRFVYYGDAQVPATSDAWRREESTSSQIGRAHV